MPSVIKNPLSITILIITCLFFLPLSPKIPTKKVRPTPSIKTNKTSWWYGFSPDDLLPTILVCYLTGRQVRSAPIIPEDDSLTGLCGDIALGFAVNSFATICHEAGHAVTYRLCFGIWPESVSIGSPESDDPEILSFFNGKIALRGCNPLAGVTRFAPQGIQFYDKKAIPVFVAGSIGGITAYYGLKFIINRLHTHEQPVYQDQFERVFFAIVAQCQIAVLLEIANLTIAYDTPGTDAYNIAMALSH